MITITSRDDACAQLEQLEIEALLLRTELRFVVETCVGDELLARSRQVTLKLRECKVRLVQLEAAWDLFQEIHRVVGREGGEAGS